MSEPLWSDERIVAEVDDSLWEADSETRERARRLLRQLRDSYQAKLATLRAEKEALKAELATKGEDEKNMPTSRNPQERLDFWTAKDNGTLYMNRDQLCKKVAELLDENEKLREQISFAARYKGIEGAPCQLCKYENGVFIEACQMHKDIAELRAQVAEQAQWETLDKLEDVDKKPNVITRAQYRALIASDWRLQRRKEANHE